MSTHYSTIHMYYRISMHHEHHTLQLTKKAPFQLRNRSFFLSFNDEYHSCIRRKSTSRTGPASQLYCDYSYSEIDFGILPALSFLLKPYYIIWYMKNPLYCPSYQDTGQKQRIPYFYRILSKPVFSANLIYKLL